MPVASILSEITDLLTTVVGDYGLYAVFMLMLIDAVFPAASEPVMVYGGAVAAGAFAGQDIMLFGRTIESGFPAFLAEVAPAVADGSIRYRETIVDGIERAPEAFIGLLEGANVGKMLVRVGPEE